MTPPDDWRSRLASLLPDDAHSAQPDGTHAAGAPSHDADAHTASEGLDAQKARLDIVYERKGRAGKPATIITGFTVDDDTIAALASDLKKRLGTGGSSRGGEILIQGDRRNDLLRLLTSKGLKARII